MNTDELYMNRCIELARLTNNSVAPNPMVGAVIVYKDKIIGEGFHQVYGGPHAEVNAVNSVEDKSLLSESTIYVSLEPCSHVGKTPPCSDLIVRSQFKRVVVGTVDPHSVVSGKGIEHIRNAGIEVTVGVLEKACLELNKRFFTFHQKKRPYVVLKWAQSRDGFMDINREKDEKGVFWISSPETKSLVHKWRSEEPAILVGRRTVQNDNPSLTVRAYHGKNPLRVIIDSQLKLDPDQNVFSGEAETLIINRIKDEVDGTITYVKVNEISTTSILDELYKRQILSVFIEGGRKTIQHFLSDHCWDEARVIVGKNRMEQGVNAPQITKVPDHAYPFGGDMIYHYFRK